MNLLTVTRWELRGTFRSRKFLFIFIFQILVLSLTIFMFSGFIEMIGEENTFTPSLRGFAELSVTDPSGIISGQLNPDILYIHGGAPSRLLVDNFTGIPLNATLYLDYSDPRRTVVRDEVEAAVERASTVITREIIEIPAPRPEVREETRGEALPLQLVRRVMVSILLFLPVFLFGNLVVDSIVGEKERKTGEALIAMPIRRSEIIIGKCLSVTATVALQVGVWMILIMAAGFQISNPAGAYFTVVLSSTPIIGLTALISVYAKNYREAGIGITFAYIIAAAYLIVPALAYMAGSSGSLSPMTLTIKMISGVNLNGADIIPPLASVLLLNIIFYGLAVRLFSRDDVVFGPRPGILRLMVKP
ncbi:ABC transporter permease [Methanothermobacter sp.]|uniref:ABC transporter permease n=1 Tax=Methanothermobacter sp. TaxID=1884223 RepID=UPI003C75F740